ncbi:hypothetical protein WUBG_18220 [Wuchereria bancrofti]|uniref:Uncharacterized protein n=1 Tax=Wuchereria bancrofti TaxID=6293 RepID=J9DMN0_WUCBA|nr:hypothetical protein WUBG_18220 [Wuchereria bancrofti]
MIFRESSGRNGSIISQAASTMYSVEQKDDLKLSLRVSRHEHGYHMNSSSSDECQSFLLSPPHRVVSPRLEMPILSPPYRRLSTPIASPKESSGRNGSIISQAASTMYSVEQKDDLKLSLRVSRHEVSFQLDL